MTRYDTFLEDECPDGDTSTVDGQASLDQFG